MGLFCQLKQEIRLIKTTIIIFVVLTLRISLSSIFFFKPLFQKFSNNGPYIILDIQVIFGKFIRDRFCASEKLEAPQQTVSSKSMSKLFLRLKTSVITIHWNSIRIHSIDSKSIFAPTLINADLDGYNENAS